MTRSHDWMHTFTGRRFRPLDPRPEDVCIEDIAHALSMVCRYAGHVQRFYSVAEHSYHVATVVSDRLQAKGTTGPEYGNVLRWALLHDAAEAYVGDMIQPVKHQPEMGAFREMEAGVMLAVREALGLVGPEPLLVRAVDRDIVGTEVRVLKFGEGVATFDELPPMMPELRGVPLGVDPKTAEGLFMSLWRAVVRLEGQIAVGVETRA